MDRLRILVSNVLAITKSTLDGCRPPMYASILIKHRWFAVCGPVFGATGPVLVVGLDALETGM